MEITSPGGLRPGVTIDRMKEGYSQIRNRVLVHAFSYMNLIEGWGTGVPRLLREMKEYGLDEPEFVDMEIALRINLYRAQNEAQEKMILDIIVENGNITSAELMEQLNLKKRRAHFIIIGTIIIIFNILKLSK